MPVNLLQPFFFFSSCAHFSGWTLLKVSDVSSGHVRAFSSSVRCFPRDSSPSDRWSGDTGLGGLAGPSAIINYLQVLQNNNTKKCEPSISPPFTRNQYQYLMQCG